jgi:hypothetical protein
VHLDEVERVKWQATDLEWLPLRSALGTRVVGMAAFTASRVGQLVVEPHVEDRDGRGQEEVYVVLRGRASFVLDGSELDAPAGTFVLVPPEVHRSAVAAEPGTAVLALGGPPTYVPSGSEWIERARPFVRKDPARAREILDSLRAEQPSSPAVGIGEALFLVGQGNEEAARVQLAELLQRDPSLRPALVADPDLGPLLGD